MALSDCKIQDDHRSSLFYNRYTYSVNMRCEGVHHARDLDHDKMDQYVARRRQWSFASDGFINSDSHIRNLHAFIDCVTAITAPHRLTVEYNWVSFYVNDLSVLAPMVTQLEFLSVVRIKQALITRPANQILLQSSRFQYRTYLRDRWFQTPGQADAVTNMFRTYRSVWRMCPSINARLDENNVDCVRRHWFIDHEHPQDTLILEMSFPGITRKTMPIVTAK